MIFLNFIRGVKEYNVISEHVSFQKHNMSDKFLELFENLENNIFIHESVDKIKFNKKQFICLFVRFCLYDEYSKIMSLN